MFAGIGGIRSGLEQSGFKCNGWIEIDKFARKSYEEIYQPTNEWTATDITKVNAKDIPKSDLWSFGFPCQDISVAGKMKGIRNGTRSGLFYTVTKLIRETHKESKPKWLLIENVKNLLSIDKGQGFLSVLSELDEIGYDAEWNVFDSANFVPQHRERVFLIGHFRGAGTRKIFHQDGESTATNKTIGIIKQIGNIANFKSFGGNPQVGRVYGTDGISPTLNTMQGGGREPKIAIKEATKKGYAEATIGDSINLEQPNSKTRRGRVGKGIANTLTTSCNQATLDVEKGKIRIRKLTPRECWRLQGFPDESFNRAEKVNSNSQLYKQAGNSVTVPVIKFIGDLIMESINEQ